MITDLGEAIRYLEALARGAEEHEWNAATIIHTLRRLIEGMKELNSRGRGRPRKDADFSVLYDPLREETRMLVEAEENRLRKKTGKTRVKSQAVENVAKRLNRSTEAIWSRLRIGKASL